MGQGLTEQAGLRDGEESPGPRGSARFRYVPELVSLGVDAALADDPGFGKGLNVEDREITYAPVAEAYAQGALVGAL